MTILLFCHEYWECVCFKLFVHISLFAFLVFKPFVFFLNWIGILNYVNNVSEGCNLAVKMNPSRRGVEKESDEMLDLLMIERSTSVGGQYISTICVQVSGSPACECRSVGLHVWVEVRGTPRRWM